MKVTAVPRSPFRDAEEEALYHRRHRLQTLFFVYHRNHQELTKTIAAALHPSNDRKLWDFFNQEEMRRTIAEATRLLHNFVAAAATWADVSRGLIRQEYRATEFLREYEREVSARFDTNGLTRFVKGLRNFALHRELPLTTALRAFRRHPDFDALVAQHGPGNYALMESNFVLYRDPLLEWDNWHSAAKTYLLNANEEIVVTDVANQHYDLYFDFYQWLDQRLCGLVAQAEQT
jgi:hypothetical protein